ncbi:MAG: hypothetical protein FGM41_13755 [Bacteroidetes bacterium]|nr:hypothetical protein [Bacteroidota bacterium]
MKIKKSELPFTPTQKLIIEAIHSRQVTQLSNYFVQYPNKLPGLLELACGNLGHPFPEYASWILTHVANKKVSLLEKYYEPILDTLLKTNNESVRRNLLAIVNRFQLQDYEESNLLNVLFGWLANPNTKPAVVMYTLEKLKQYCKTFPELTREVIAILELRNESEITPAVKVAKRKFITGK